MVQFNSTQRTIIEILGDGLCHSGTKLGQLLGISRSAIWKQIKQLIDWGVPIISFPKQGYQLKQELILLDEKKIKEELQKEQWTNAVNLHLFSSIDSTNRYLKDLAISSDLDLCCAELQTQGRGRFGRNWHSPFGENIYCSSRWKLQCDLAKLSGLSLVTSLAIVATLQKFINTSEIKIKWPNDIYHRDSKLGGILIENTINGNRISSSVVGIGINVNQKEFDASLPNPISLFQISNAEYKLESLVELLASFIEKYYLQLRQLHFNFLDKAYTVGLFRYQQTHEFKKGEQILRGEINGVAKDGKLILHANGKEMRFGFKEVEFVL